MIERAIIFIGVYLVAMFTCLAIARIVEARVDARLERHRRRYAALKGNWLAREMGMYKGVHARIREIMEAANDD